MIEASDRVVSMFSSNKLNTKMPHVVCGLSQLSTIVTDLDSNDEILEEYRKSGVSVL
jgi:DeoR/GlpR family transcriptional regulator of sugar metabolism